MVHSVAFAPAEDLKGEFLNTSREGFRIAHDVSVYSLIAVARAAAPLMSSGGGIVTLTYYGAEKVVPKYNVMGVAKAALEATVAIWHRSWPERDSRECDFRRADQDAGRAWHFTTRRHAESPRGARAAEAQCGSGGSRWNGGVPAVRRGSGITGETIYVDCGYNIMGF